MQIPYSKNKRYLTGIDWIINMFDRMLKKSSGAGNAAQVMLELDGALDEAAFRADMTSFTEAFPVLRGSVRRDINLAPYWKIPKKPPPARLLTTLDDFSESVSDAIVLAKLTDHVNDPFPDDTLHMAFHIARHGRARTWLSMVFDHRLFDARGAEGFLALFESWRATRSIEPIKQDIETSEPAHLSNWIRKFKAGQTVNRALRGVAPSSHRLRDFAAVRDRRTRFRFIRFTEAETRAIETLAHEQAGFLMLSPFLLALCLQTLHATLARKSLDIPAYVVPVSMDMRRPGAWRAKTFFNHVSFMFLAAQARDMADRPALIQSLIGQIYEQTKARVQECYVEASMLMRILPLGILSRLARQPFKGEFGALSFSHLGETLLSDDTFMDRPLLNVCHAPRVPIPPGLGFFFNIGNGQLNVTLTYLPELLDDSDLDFIEHALRASIA